MISDRSLAPVKAPSPPLKRYLPRKVGMAQINTRIQPILMLIFAQLAQKFGNKQMARSHISSLRLALAARFLAQEAS